MKAKVRLKAVLFDLDDTLFDRDGTQGPLLDVIMQALPDLFAGIDRREAANAFYVADAAGMNEFDAGASEEIIRSTRSRTFLRMLELPEEYADRVVELYLDNYARVGKPVDGARDLLAKLADRYKLGLVSNGYSLMQRRKLNAMGVAELFDCVVLSSEFGRSKPAPEIFHHAAAQLSCKPEACLYVGNSYEHDMVGARDAGMQICWFNPRGVRLTRGNKKPVYEIASLNGLKRILKIR